MHIILHFSGHTKHTDLLSLLKTSDDQGPKMLGLNQFPRDTLKRLLISKSSAAVYASKITYKKQQKATWFVYAHLCCKVNVVSDSFKSHRNINESRNGWVENNNRKNNFPELSLICKTFAHALLERKISMRSGHVFIAHSVNSCFEEKQMSIWSKHLTWLHKFMAYSAEQLHGPIQNHLKSSWWDIYSYFDCCTEHVLS